MPEDSRKVTGGTGETKRRERQTFTAGKEKTQPEAERLLEEEWPSSLFGWKQQPRKTGRSSILGKAQYLLSMFCF